MKKVIAVLLGLMLACSVFLGGCGDKEDGKITESSPTPLGTAESSSPVAEKNSGGLANDITRASEAVSEAGSRAKDDLTKVSEKLSQAADDVKNGLSEALS